MWSWLMLDAALKAARPWAWVLFDRSPPVVLSTWRRQCLPGSWGTPLCVCRVLGPRPGLHALTGSQRVGAVLRLCEGEDPGV